MAENSFADAETIEEVLGQLAGAASMCWENINEAGVFQSEEANRFVNEAVERLMQILDDISTSEDYDMEFKSFVRKPFVVQAIEVTTENIHELSELIGEFKEDHTGPYIAADPEKVPTVTKVTPGYWVTRMGKNIRCYSNRIFTDQFMESTPSIERVLNKFDVEAPRAFSATN